MIKLTERLMAAASQVRPGAVLADVGTDHAYLPVYLLEQGICRRAVASDLREGPLAHARRTVENSGFAERVKLVLCDGLEAVPHDVTDIVIAGMGGETILSILKAAPFVKQGDKRLILQPMTDLPLVRRSLADDGFAIVRETLAVEQGRFYVVMTLHYAGQPQNLGFREQYLIGPCEAPAEIVRRYLAKLRRKYAIQAEGLRRSATEQSDRLRLLDEILAEITKMEGELEDESA
ncbi:class I SAM-dependent methyltransferase [Feifania hominis]|uniref:SAM-dependent methyltransferase n=1 Tax=Feifania hominis TaxID=2763660 RepID=A0A926HTT7_9FIRM|nr:class I SAM-dependent methyltransferase [Feifania hominis]MBC8535638.1 SAM-dependent methyltransferase [Feifania hominis]